MEGRDKWIFSGLNPEGKPMFKRVKAAKLKKTPDGTPEPPSNFAPGDFPPPGNMRSPILTHVQAIVQAEEEKEDRAE